MSEYDGMAPLPLKAGRGGKRPGAGRPHGTKRKFTDEIPAGMEINPEDDPSAAFAIARARKEVADANLKELDFQVRSKQFLPREDVRQAIATAYATVAQTLRSIPDNLERKLGISTDVSEQVGMMIDECMGDLALDLERIHSESERTPAGEAETRKTATAG